MSRGEIDGHQVVRLPNAYPVLTIDAVAAAGRAFRALEAQSLAKRQEIIATVRTAMLEAGEATTKHACTMADKDNQPAFEKLRALRSDGQPWSFIDGPITANNSMGVHHAWGRSLKDLIQRHRAMQGHDLRYQNGFDCQGLWVEVNVEKDLGFTSKRDIESYGVAAFVSLCKQRVLTFAARQTEQSIRLGYWMDWNDPEELRRLRDLLAADPSQVVTVEGPDGPVTDTVEMIVGRLGMPEVGGSYFTFSNENNDLIWGFLAECHRRGWLYKGHDSMPWCPRCGTGISQMEMNEGYADREDPGLTVRFPLEGRPGEALLVRTGWDRHLGDRRS